MKTLRLLSLHHLLAWLGVCLLSGSCVPTEPGPDGRPIVTEAGLPNGAPVSAVIGPGGGQVASADGRVKLQIPAGALDAATTITVQPLTNKAPQGMAGAAYRLTPDGQTFKVPAKLTFTFNDNLLAGTPPELLWIVTQAADGSWQALRKSSVNTTARTVSGEIKHFSDWGLGRFLDLSLEPAAPVLKPGQSVGLSVSGFAASTDPDEELTPLVPLGKPAGDALEPLVPFEKRNSLYKVVKWNLAGEGALAPGGLSATYTAPGRVPARNPVAVSVEMARFENGQPAQLFSKTLLVSNITIAEAGVLVVNVDGTEHIFRQAAGANIAAIVVDAEYVAWQGGTNGSFPLFTFYRALKATGSHTHQCEEAADEVSYLFGGSAIYSKQWYDDRGTLHCASFTSHISEYGGKFGESIVGTFSGSLYDAGGKLHPTSGYFNLKRIN